MASSKAFIKWTKKLSMGIPEIDEQHKLLIGLVNEVHADVVKGHVSNEELESILNQLVDYVRIHFTTEENYFKKFKYVYAREHISQHERLIVSVLQFKDRFDKEGASIMGDLAEFLKKWFEIHLSVYDRKYSDTFKEQGLI